MKQDTVESSVKTFSGVSSTQSNSTVYYGVGAIASEVDSSNVEQGSRRRSTNGFEACRKHVGSSVQQA